MELYKAFLKSINVIQPCLLPSYSFLEISSKSVLMGEFMIIGATSNMLRLFFESFLAYFIERFFLKCH